MITTGTAKAPTSIRPSLPIRTSPFADGPFGLMGAAMRFARDAEIFGENEEAEYLYQVISGAVRTYRMLDDGRRQSSTCPETFSASKLATCICRRRKPLLSRRCLS
jgi:CRP/FNR family nitrogen fixation transcriptional regulator